LGYLGFIVTLIPETAVAPILIFVGLEITAQSFLVTPIRHYKAVAIGYAPVLATLVLIEVNGMLGGAGASAAALKGEASSTYQTLVILSNGFIIASLIWTSALSLIIDHLFLKAALFLFGGGILTLFGVIHSPDFSGRMFLPWNGIGPLPLQIASAYFLSGFLLLALKGRASPASTGK
jgi:AGZA family xanthine/uracil permease-like MFS transporter